MVKISGKSQSRRQRPRRSSGKKPSSRKAASLVFFYYGDSKQITLFQETLRLKRAMQGYDYKVLLKHEVTPSWLDFSEKDEKLADIKAPPTKDNLKKYVVDLAKDGYMIDLYIFAHGSPNLFTASGGSHNNTVYFRSSDVLSILASSGLSKLPIRVVYQAQCYGQSLNAEWRQIGAKVSTGARGVTFFPHAFGNFIKQWNKGNVAFSTAVAGSQTASVRTTGQLAMQAHATGTRKQWGGCPFGKTILGKHSCAREYFDHTWFGPGEWQSSMSGKQNINYASRMLTSGATTTTKNTVPVW